MKEQKPHFVSTVNIKHPETGKYIVEVGSVINTRLITRCRKMGVDNIPCVLFIPQQENDNMKFYRRFRYFQKRGFSVRSSYTLAKMATLVYLI